jgi:hypothetical protein
MKFEEFKKYKMMAESENTELLRQYPEAERVYQWMEETGRIDEGFWASIWSWLKRNLSPTARKLNNLADEYEKELEAEYQALYGKFKNSKDLDAKFRTSFAGRIAEDIDEKMDIVAGEDEDYRELKRNLINKKNLKVKKKLINELMGKMDPDELPGSGFPEALTKTEREEKDADKKLEASFSKVTTQNPDTAKQASEALRKKIKGQRDFIEMGIDTDSKVQELIQKLFVYQNSLTELGKADFTVKALEITLKNFRDFVTAGAKKLSSNKISYDKAIELIRKSTEKRLMDNKPVVFSKMQSEVFIEAEEAAKKETEGTGTTGTGTGASTPETEVEKQSTGPLTGDVLKPEEIKNAEEIIVSHVGEEATKEEIVKELDGAVKIYFNDNKKLFMSEVTKRVEEFNNLSDKDRATQQGNFEYELNTQKKLDLPTATTIESLYTNLLQVAGKIVPYYNLEKGKRSKAFYFVLDFMFEIYAIKKNDTGSLSDADIETLAENIKEKYK